MWEVPIVDVIVSVYISFFACAPNPSRFLVFTSRECCERESAVCACFRSARRVQDPSEKKARATRQPSTSNLLLIRAPIHCDHRTQWHHLPPNALQDPARGLFQLEARVAPLHRPHAADHAMTELRRTMEMAVIQVHHVNDG